ncbi:hypothetical protein BGZ65_010761 [Modicella reniformis]|uniref:Uncharacterized protein n=1 Tax=Modicella reniformis TaxID=1440133 RepID=A0A9P6LRL3_9FUNG|nr:hypothetical protein BGZ65_010761 [Modicella reniformis]
MLSQHELVVAAKLELEHELNQKALAHDETLTAKLTLIQELEQKVAGLELSLESSDDDTKGLVAKAQAELSEALTQLKKNQAKEEEQQKAMDELTDKLSALDADAAISRDALLDKDTEHAKAIQALETRVKLAEVDRDDAETRREEAERRREAVQEEIKVHQTAIAQHLVTIELLQAQAQQGLSASLPLSASSSVGTLASNEDQMAVIQKLEMEKARYRNLVRINEKEIEGLNRDLESLASEFMEAATAFEDAEDKMKEMKARISELEALVDGRNINQPNNNSSASNDNTQLATLRTERDQAVQSSEELSSIVAELSEKNHSLQERLRSLEGELESIKLQHTLEHQQQQDEIRGLRDRAERLDRNASPSPVGLHHMDDERILRHKSSCSSEQLLGNRGEETFATPRQSWSTTASQQHSPMRPGRHESSLIQQAKHIKMLEERIAELQVNGASPANGDGSIQKLSLLAPATAMGLNIQHKSSDPELSRSVSPLIPRNGADRV